MATKVSGDFGLSGQSLIGELRKRAPKLEGQANFIGLQRSLALSDLEDPTESLNNVLDKISLTESAERNQYGGPFNALDWDVTSDFVDEQIDKSFLSRLQNVSIGGGSLGSSVSTTPRIRIQDRLSFLNSFYGEGSFPGLHSGPDAMFYRSPEPDHIGYVKFTFNSSTGSVTTTELKEPDKITNLSLPSILGTESAIILDLVEYETAEGLTVNLSGTGISLRLDSPSTWSVTGTRALSSLSGIRSSVGGQVTFAALRFKLVRPYSVLYKPSWFTQDPADPIVAGGADDTNLTTTNRIMRNDNGTIKPYIEKGYWYSRAYVETRWTPTEYSLLSNTQQNNTIVTEDSNMRWQQPPSSIRSEVYNWGIRWDGYLRIGPGIYSFEVQSNVAVKIDMATGSGGAWVEVFNTDTAAQESEQRYVSSQSFNTDDVSSTYKYMFESGWVAYIPITIRLYHGGPDKIDDELIVPSEPNLFIKTTSLDTEVSFYSENYIITLSGADGSWSVDSSALADIITILQDTDASVSYRLTAEGDDIFTTPVSINLATDGTNVTSTTTGLSATTYTLTISPDRASVNFNNNLTALWKGRIASPSPIHTGYTDLADGSYEPNLQKIPFDLRPEWWKVSEGHPYNLDSPANDDNTPLDGFLRNEFKSTLKSDVEGLGLYGDGGELKNGTFTIENGIMTGTGTEFLTDLVIGSKFTIEDTEFTVLDIISDLEARVSPDNVSIPSSLSLSIVTYKEVPNIIFGESKYSVNSKLGSNYYGLRLTPNLVGEGGKLSISSLPVNSTEYNDTTLLGEDGLGGSPNHLTEASGKVSSETIKLFLADLADTADDKYDKYYTLFVYTDLASFPVSGDVTVTYFDNTDSKYYTWDGSTYVEDTTPSSDDPTSYGLPAFSDNAWLSPITVSVVQAGSQYLTAPLTMVVERLEFTPGVFFLQFSTTQPSLLTGGADIGDFSGEDITFYTESNVAFQYLRVDSGEGIAFADVLKLTYDDSDVFQGVSSEVPRPPSDRVTPFGFDNPQYTAGLCYPPYSIANTLLSGIAIEDADLYDASTPVGNYDVFWGDQSKSDLGGKTLTVTEKLEFQQADDNAVEEIVGSVTVAYDDYTHRFKIDMPLSGSFDPDMLEHTGNLEKVKESYYAYVKLD